MSVSVDDLVASLSANHIGQEALDLAALQTQLAQSLLTHQLSSQPQPPSFVHGVTVNVVRRDPTSVQHCTTPTARTPSSASCTWPPPEHADHARRRSISHARRMSTDNPWCDFEEMAEERAVEDMVTPDSPCAQHAHLWSAPRGDAHAYVARVLPTSGPTPLLPSGVTSPTDLGPSLFTSTDPFYLQASQATQQSHTPFFGHHVGMPNSQFIVRVPSWE